MVWVTPRTWADGNVVTAAQLNQDIRDNTNELYDASIGIVAAYATESADFETQSQSYVDVISVTLTTTGKPLLLLAGGLYGSNYRTAYFAYQIDSQSEVVMLEAPDSSTGWEAYEMSMGVLMRVITGVAAGDHTIKIRVRTTASGGVVAWRGRTLLVYELPFSVS